MTTRELIDQAVFTIFGLGCVGLQVAFLWGVSGSHI
jgi:hypothetical protein